MKTVKILGIGMLIIMVNLSTHKSLAQTIEITPSYGYQFGSKLNDGPNYLKIDDSDQFGVTISVETPMDIMAELTYIHHSTELRLRDVIISNGEERLSDLSIDWIQLGALKYFSDDKIQPFVGGGGGLAFFSPKNENRDLTNRSMVSSTKFFFAFKGGVNIMLSDVIGINLQGNLLFPVEWGGFYVGGGTGGFSSGVGLSSTTIIAGFSGGLVFRLNTQKSKE